MAEAVKVAICGAGYWGKNYVRAANELGQFDVKYVVDMRMTDDEFRGGWEAKYPSCKYITDMQEALDDPEIEALVVATPASTHFELGKRVLGAGKHALVEKPLATTSKDAEELVAIAKSSGLRLMVGFTALFIPSVVRAKQIVQEGLDGHEFGRPYYMYTTRVNLGIVRHDVNVNWDLSPHDVSMFCHFLDSKPLWVSATGCKFVSDQEDALFATIHFENGVNAHMTVSWAEPKKTREMVIVSNQMRVSIDDVDVMAPLKVYKQAMERVTTSEGSTASPTARGGGGLATNDYGASKLITKMGDLVVPNVGWGEPLKNKLSHLAACIRDPSLPCTASGELGATVVRVLEAIDESMAKCGAPVAIDAASEADISYVPLQSSKK